MYIYDDEVRRADFKLRIQYPELDTEIYKESGIKYSIYCQSYEGDFEALKKEFKDSIRMISCPVGLTRERPVHYMEILQPISMDNPVSEFRASVFTESDVKNFVESRFSDVEIKKIRHNAGPMYSVDITVGADTSVERMEDIKKVLAACLSTDKVRIQCDETGQALNQEQKETSAQEEALHSAEVRFFIDMMESVSLSFHKNLLWAADEADYWFSHAEEIYLNAHGQPNMDNRIKIPYFRDGQKNCFMDCTVYGTYMDIRQALVLYDTVYIGMPRKDVQDRFFQLQQMTKAELLALVSMGKVVLIVTGLESHYDAEFLNAVYKEAPLGVIGRRAANTLVAAYISEMQWRYTKNYPDIYEYTRDLYRVGHKEGNQRLIALADAAAYPLKAKAQSFEYLNTHGLMNLSIFGVNTVYESILKEDLSEEGREDLMFRFMTDAYPIHLAEALNATYIPYRHRQGEKVYSDFYVADLQESLLMQYWYCDFQIGHIKTGRLKQGVEQLKLFETTKGLSVLDIAQRADKYNTPDAFGDIIQSLSRLPLEKQNEKIREYNHLVLEISEQPDKSSFAEMMLTGAGYVPMGDALAGCVNAIGLMSKFANSREYMREYKEKQQYKRKLKSIEGVSVDDDLLNDIYLLDKIYKVARLKPAGYENI